jgi:hypothetical protein
MGRRPLSLAGFANLGGSMTLDRFRFLLVETNQFRPGLPVGTQQFVQFGV